MICFTPSRNSGDAERALATLVNPRLDPLLFARRIQRLQQMFFTYTTHCPPPWPGPGLQITPEISCRSELWLPLDQLRHHFQALYRYSLRYPPILTSTPFAQMTSWASIVSVFPYFQMPYDNPAALLEHLVNDDGLRTKFLFWSFMPRRFYGGGSDRYSGQSIAITEWLRRRGRQGRKLRCLDAACGDGAATYALVHLCTELGWTPESLEVEGWTLEPLEVWSAAYGRFPHEPARERAFLEETGDCFERGSAASVRFCCVDILDVPASEPFDLILCNGLLGPIIHTRRAMELAVRSLAGLLAPGGMLLAADHFHGGWKQKYPQQELRVLCQLNGLHTEEAGEGIAGLSPQAG